MAKTPNTKDLVRGLAIVIVFVAGIGTILGTNSVNNVNEDEPDSPTRVQILTFDYDVQNLPNSAAVAAALLAGTRAIGEFMPATACVFTANFTVEPNPDFNLNGLPGEVGANLSIVSTNPSNASSSNPAGCPAIEEIVIFLGSTDTSLDLGVPQNQSSADFTIGGEMFSTQFSGYMSASLDAFDSSDNYMTGQFEFLARQPGASSVVIRGSFSGN